MANLIQIKRSLTTAAPGSLANGEQAYTANGDVLYIGSNGAVVPIGGKRTPGTLTANQALVANSTSGIDRIIVANLEPTSIFANGSLGSANNILKSNGANVYWAVDTGDIEDVTAGNGLTGGGSSGNVTIDVGAGSGISVNATAVSVLANSGIVSNATGVFVLANSGIVSNATGVFVNAGTGVTVNATGVHIGQAVETTSNVTFSNVVTTNLTVNGTALIGDSTSDIVSLTARVNTAIVPSANITNDLGSNLLRWSNVYAQNFISVTGDFSGNVSIGGDLVVTGNVTTINVSSLSVSDPLIKLAVNNTIDDLLYIGFAGHYNGLGNTTNHAGLVRSPSNKNFYLFSTYGDEAGIANNTVDVASPSFSLANLTSYLLSGGVVTNASHVAITANSTVNVSIQANSLTLSTALIGTSGGTGKATITSEAILVGNTSNGYRELVVGSDGFVLQSNGTTLSYGSLDGGTF